MNTSQSGISAKLRAQATDALRRARRLPVGPHRNDLRQLAIGLRSLGMRELGCDLETSVATLAGLPSHVTAPGGAGQTARLAS